MGCRQLLIFLSIFVFFACSSESELEQDLKASASVDSRSVSTQTLATKIEYYPQFSWDYVSVYGHIYCSGSNFTEEQCEYYANLYSFVTLGNAHGSSQIGTDIERHTAAVMIKKFNPNCKVIAYRSINSDNTWSSGKVLSNEEYDYMELVSSDGVAQSKLDHRYQTYVEYWKECVFNILDLGALDGLYVDSYGGYNDEDSFTDLIGHEASVEKQQAVFGMIDDVNARYDNTKLVIGNGFSCREITDIDSEVISQHVTGGMIDHFANYSCADAQSISDDIEIIRYMARIQKVCVVKAWTRYDASSTPDGLSQEEKEAVAREDVVFPLACFLMGAGEYSYFCYSWHWGMENGGSMDLEEYSKPLGEPLGDYTNDGWNYYREFEHAKVWANLETHNATIEWEVDSF